MRIREDYIGNSAINCGVLHGLKDSAEHNDAYPRSFCGAIVGYPPPVGMSNEKMTDEQLLELTSRITCKRCRHLMKLPKHIEKPDYFLVVDTSDGILEDVSPVVAATQNEEYLKTILSAEADRIGFERVNNYYRVIGIKEVSDIHIDIKPKGYDIVLTKQ